MESIHSSTSKPTKVHNHNQRLVMTYEPTMAYSQHKSSKRQYIQIPVVYEALLASLCWSHAIFLLACNKPLGTLFNHRQI